MHQGSPSRLDLTEPVGAGLGGVRSSSAMRRHFDGFRAARLGEVAIGGRTAGDAGASPVSKDSNGGYMLYMEYTVYSLYIYIHKLIYMISKWI